MFFTVLATSSNQAIQYSRRPDSHREDSLACKTNSIKLQRFLHFLVYWLTKLSLFHRKAGRIFVVLFPGRKCSHGKTKMQPVISVHVHSLKPSLQSSNWSRPFLFVGESGFVTNMSTSHTHNNIMWSSHSYVTAGCFFLHVYTSYQYATCRLLAEVNILSSDESQLRWQPYFHSLVPLFLHCEEVS